MGMWAYLASKARDKSRIELERTRTEGTRQILDRLPYGAVIREGTADGWREIQMPDAPQSPLFLIPTENRSPGGDALGLAESRQRPVTLGEGDKPEQLEGALSATSADSGH